MGRDGAAVAQFFATYGVSASELKARGLRMREVGFMVANMPPGSPRWNQSHELMAATVDAIGRLTYTLMYIKTEKKHRSKLEHPEPYPRPGRKPSRIRGESLARPTRSFETPEDFMRWRASRLRPSAQSC